MPRQEFLERARREAAALQAAGCGNGTPVLVACVKPQDAAIAYLAAVLAGATPMIAPYRPALDGADRSSQRLQQLRAALGPDSMLIVRAGGRSVLGDPAHCIELSSSVSELAPQAPYQSGVVHGAEVHLQATSGSTSAPRPVVVTHRSLLANISAIVADLDIGADDVMVNWLPLYHDLGLVFGFLTGLLAGASVNLISPFQFLRDPGCWLAGLSELHGTLTASPTSGLAHVVGRLRNGVPPGADLSRVRHLVCGGEPVDAAILRAFARLVEPAGFAASALAPSYGLAEATVYVSSWSQPDPPQRLAVTRASMARLDQIEIVSEGSVVDEQPIDDTRHAELVAVGRRESVPFSLIDENGVSITSDDRCGEIVVAGPSVAAGYRAVDGAIEPFDESGIATGDVGFLHDGLLYVIERLKNTIIRLGQNYAPLALEDLLATRLGVAAHHVVVIDSDLRPGHGRVIAVVEAPDEAVVPVLAQRALQDQEHFELPVEELIIVRSGTLPRTTSGKKQHHSVRRQLGAGGLPIVSRYVHHGSGAQPAVIDLRDSHRDQVIDIIDRHARKQGCTSPVAADAHLANDLMIDSMCLYDVVVDIEGRLNIGLPDRSLKGIATVADLLAAVDLVLAGGFEGEGVGAAAERLRRELPGLNLTVQEQQGRMLRIDERWFVDFASCNYLGLDLHPEVASSIAPLIAQWGTHPSWTRAIASPQPYQELEAELAATVGVADTVVFPAVTLLHSGVLPRVVERTGLLLLDGAVHHSVQDAAALVRNLGGTVQVFRHGDYAHLEELLARGERHGRRVIAVDGVYSMSGAPADLRRLQEIARRYDAVVYVDDAHGFGVLGENPSAESPYGHGGNGVIRWLGLDYDRTIYVAGLSKAYSSMGAFVTCSGGVDRELCQSATTLVFSGPLPVASLATSLAGLRLNRSEGERWRQTLLDRTKKLVHGLEDIGFAVQTPNLLPIVNVVIGGPAAVVSAANSLWAAGVLCTPSVYPATPLHAGGTRFTVTAANTDAQVELVLEAMARVRRSSRVHGIEV